MHYELNLQDFKGPLAKLLELIEAKQLEITSVSLAEVTNDFLRYLEGLKSTEQSEQYLVSEEAYSALLADFLVIAAKLILIKSRALIPDLTLTKEEEQDVRTLESRLNLYREFAATNKGPSGERSAASLFRELWREAPVFSSRPLFFTLHEQRIFYPPSTLAAHQLSESLERLAKTWQEFIPPKETIAKTFVSIEEKIQELKTRFEEVFNHSFKNLSEKKNRSEVVALFLAMLHLLKNKLITVEQPDHFGDILLKKI